MASFLSVIERYQGLDESFLRQKFRARFKQRLRGGVRARKGVDLSMPPAKMEAFV